MTEPVRPDDRELDAYLAGGSKLSRRYRDASSETAPAELDELVLAQARAEARRKPSLNKLLTPLAVAASLLLGVNLAWRVYDVEPVPLAEQAAREASGARARQVAGAPPRKAEAPVAASEPAPAAAAPPAPPEVLEAIEVTATRIPEAEAQAAAEQDRAQQDAQRKRDLELRESFAKQAEAQRRAAKEQDSHGYAAPVVDSAPAPAAALAESKAPLPLTDEQKIERLIAHVGRLEGAVFIRNGEEHTAADAAKHLAYKRKKAGDRVKTPDDFIRLCASYSTVSKEAYLIRFADGRTRTAEDVLRDELARMEGLR